MASTYTRTQTNLIGTQASPAPIAISASANGTVATASGGSLFECVIGGAVIIGGSVPTSNPTVQFGYTLDGTNYISDGGPFVVPVTTGTYYYGPYEPPVGALGANVVVTNGTGNAITAWFQASTVGGPRPMAGTRGKPGFPRIYHPEDAPAFWALMAAPQKTFGADTGDVGDLACGIAAGVRGTGVTWVDGPRGKCLSFAGTGGVSLGAPKVNSNWPLTVSLWAKPIGPLGSYIKLITKGLNSEFSIDAATTTLFSINLYSGAKFFWSASAGVWQHYAFTCDPTRAIVGYYNGRQFATSTADASGYGSGGRLYLGTDNGTGSFFTGLMDDVRIYNRVLTPAEIARDYADPYWRLRRPRNHPIYGPVWAAAAAQATVSSDNSIIWI